MEVEAGGGTCTWSYSGGNGGASGSSVGGKGGRSGCSWCIDWAPLS